MRYVAWVVVPFLAGVVVGPAAQSRPVGERLDAALAAFWRADSPRVAEGAAAQILAAQPSFEALWDAMKAGRPYARKDAGRVAMATTDQGIALDNAVEIPDGYDPARAWPVRVTLHGGVGREAPKAGEPPARPLTNRIVSAGEIVIHPRAWAQSEWWRAGQVENIFRLLDKVKRDYNVDESRVYVTGISDGGTGVYFLGMRAATPWAACLPLNGHPLVLANPDTGADGALFPANLANCPLYIVNGGRDRLYPADSVQPFVDMFTRGGVPNVFRVYPAAGHDVSWWPQERPRYEQFLATHARVAHPPTVSWETERTDRYNRFRWLVIDRLEKRASDQPLPDVNTFEAAPGTRRALYARRGASGRVDVTRKGNAFEAKTRGVGRFTLLLSPDVVDFSRPVTVTVNGASVHNGPVKKDPATLVRWAARDNDRTMLYAAELPVTVP